MELKRETICEDTLEFVQEYYCLNTESLFSILADDCVWIGTGNVLASGAAAIRGFFKDGFIMPPFHLADPDFRLVETGCEGQLIVLGQYALYSDGDAQLISAVKPAVYVLFPGGKRPVAALPYAHFQRVERTGKRRNFPHSD